MTLASRPIAYFCLGLSMTLVGSYVALSKPLALIFPVMLLAWLRFGIGAIAMLGWVKRPANEPPLSRQTRWLLFFESFFGNFLFTLCMITGVALTRVDDTNVTLTLSAGAPTALVTATSLTLGWTGTLAVSRGGTNIASYAIGDLLYASAGTTLSTSSAPAQVASRLWSSSEGSPNTVSK